MRANLAFAAAIVVAAASPAHAGDIDCRTARWEGHAPAINVGHIFCGEIRRRPDGYHSEAIAPTPFVVGVSGRRDAGHGVYNGMVQFTDGERKFSTFYPVGCSVGQILASVRYAVAQPRTPKRGGWGFVAQSAPIGAGGDGFCRGDDGAPFMIRYGLLSRGDVSTAFPDVAR